MDHRNDSSHADGVPHHRALRTSQLFEHLLRFSLSASASLLLRYPFCMDQPEARDAVVFTS